MYIGLEYDMARDLILSHFFTSSSIRIVCIMFNLVAILFIN